MLKGKLKKIRRKIINGCRQGLTVKEHKLYRKNRYKSILNNVIYYRFKFPNGSTVVFQPLVLSDELLKAQAVSRMDRITVEPLPGYILDKRDSHTLDSEKYNYVPQGIVIGKWTGKNKNETNIPREGDNNEEKEV